MTVWLGGTELEGRLVDLPCIVESQKTLDNVNIYKSADICQVSKRVSVEFFLSKRYPIWNGISGVTWDLCENILVAFGRMV